MLMVIRWILKTSHNFQIYHLSLIHPRLSLVHKVSQLNTCVGNCDARLIHLATQKKNHQFLSFRQEVITFPDKSVCVSYDGQQYPCTIRHHDCHLLSTENRTTCSNYRKTLLCMSLRLERSTGIVHKNVNHR